MSEIIVASLYQFLPLPDREALRDRLLRCCQSLGIKGTLLLANEGINGTVAGSRGGIDGLRAELAADGRFDGLEYKESTAAEQPFLRLKVRLKREIVSMGVPGADPTRRVGRYADVDRWHQLLDDPETLVIDTRNDYEIAVGRFDQALAPGTGHFREFPDFVRRELDPARHRRIAMYCTGGIRCEKASHHLLEQGFEEVWHLRGGILRYLEEVNPAHNRWRGECFVFDDRVSVDHQLQPGEHRLCRACRHPVSAEQRRSPLYEEGISCPHCHARQSAANRERARARRRQVELAEARGGQHLGPAKAAGA